MAKGINFGGRKGSGIFEKKIKVAKVNYTSEEKNIEQDPQDELTELQQRFRAKAKAEKELNEKNTSGDFFTVVVFKTEQQRDEFLDRLGISAGIDRPDDRQYIDGVKLAKALDLRITEVNDKAPGKFRVNKEIAELAMKL